MSTPPEHPLVPPSQPRQAPPAYPYAAPTPMQQWPQQPPPGAAYSGWAQPQPAAPQDPEAGLRKARTALGWAIGAAVGAFVALALAVIAMFMSGFGLLADGGTFYESLRGQAVGVTDGGDLPGDDLEVSLAEVLDEWYVDVEDLTCPDTASVGPSSTVVCTARLDGFEWTGVVFFEDSEGRFVILEL